MLEPTTATVAAASTTASAASPALSPAQLKAALWADDRQHVYAVLMGRVIADLPARLAAASDARQIGDHDCLRPGALTPAEQQAAPYLARLQRDSAFTDWLLFDAAAEHGDWGVLARTAAPKLALRSHLRGLLAAQIPGGQRIALEWTDPLILDAILPLFAPADALAFMGPVQALVSPAAAAWTTWRLVLGRLERATVALASATAAGGR